MSSMLSTAAPYSCSTYHHCQCMPHEHVHSSTGMYVLHDEASLGGAGEQHPLSPHHSSFHQAAAGGVPTPLLLSPSTNAYSPTDAAVYVSSPVTDSHVSMYLTTSYDCLASPEAEHHQPVYYGAYSGAETPTSGSSPSSSPQRSPFVSSPSEYSSPAHIMTPHLPPTAPVSIPSSPLSLSPTYASPAHQQQQQQYSNAPVSLPPPPPGYTYHYPVYQPCLVPVGQAPPAGYSPYPVSQGGAMPYLVPAGFPGSATCIDTSLLGTAFDAPAPSTSTASTTSAFLAQQAAQARRDRRSARQRDPSYVPRPANPFICFRQDWLKRLQRGEVEYSGPRDQRTMSFRISADWNGLDEVGKGKFRREALQRKRMHAMKYPGYKFAPKQKDYRELEDGGLLED